MKMTSQPTRYDNKSSRWMKWDRAAWNVDCCRMIKGFLWGFDYDKYADHGGAVWRKGYPDYTTEGMIAHCRDVSSDMSKDAIRPGELLWMKGHVGLYVGDGNVIEAAPSLKGCACTSLSYQRWEKHGFIREIDYGEQPTPAPVPQLKPGEKLSLTNEPLYASSTRTEPSNHVTGTYYLTDGKLIRGRVRICSKPAYVGDVSQTLGWIDWRY